MNFSLPIFKNRPWNMAKERDDVCPSAFPRKFKNPSPCENSLPAFMEGSVTPWLKTLQELPMAFRIKPKLLNADFMTLPYCLLFIFRHPLIRLFSYSQFLSKFCPFSKPWLVLLPLAGTFPAAMVPSSHSLSITRPATAGWLSPTHSSLQHHFLRELFTDSPLSSVLIIVHYNFLLHGFFASWTVNSMMEKTCCQLANICWVSTLC